MSLKTIISIAVVWMVGLVVVVAGVYFMREQRRLQTEFTPLLEVCQGKAANVASVYSPTPGKHQAVAVRNSADGPQLDSLFLPGLIPGEAAAASLAETQVVLCMGKVQAIFIERCPYTSRDQSGVVKVVDRYYLKQEARLVEAKTGRVIAVQTFTGNSPHYCHEKEWFSKSDKVVHLTGSEIADNDVKRWVQPHLIIH
jgi:hypothetical protein